MGNPKIVTIFGGSGFLGRYITRRMAQKGWRIRVAVRHPNEALFVRTYGTVGQVEPIFANVRDDVSVHAAISGADAIINCVGILNNLGKQTFQTIHIDAATRIAQIAAKENVKKLIHISAIGADIKSKSTYARSKATAEKAVTQAYKNAIILRPSIIFGDEDNFFNLFATMAKFTPILPIVGGESKFQPIYVDDVAACVEKAVLESVKPGIYELGGAEILTLNTLIKRMLHVIRRKRLIINMPFFMARILAWGFDIAQKITFELFKNRILTRDQVKLLSVDNIVSSNAKNMATLGIEPTAMDAILDNYLYRHRPYGQYTILTESAQNLKDK